MRPSTLARTLLGSRLEEYGPVHAFRWGTLLALAAVPPAYYAVLSFDARAETGTVLLLTAAGSAVLAQLAAALRPRAAGGFRGAPAAAASLVLLLGMGVRTAETPAAAQTLSVLWVAFAANLLTAVLHRHTRLAFLAPAGFAAALLLGVGVLGIRGYELLLRRWRSPTAWCWSGTVRPGLRGIYLAGAQATGTVLAALLAADAAGNSISVFFAALGLGLAAGQILRTVFHDRLVVLGAVEPLRWGGLSALALVSASCLLFEDLLDSAAVLTAVLSAAAVFAGEPAGCGAEERPGQACAALFGTDPGCGSGCSTRRACGAGD